MNRPPLPISDIDHRAHLEPQVLSVRAERAVAEMLIEGESANTRSSYRSALHYWSGWFACRYGQAITLPLPAASVVQFIVDHAQRTVEGELVHELPPEIDAALVKAGFKAGLGPFKLSTLLHRVSVLSKAHQLKQLNNPCASIEVRELLSKVRRGYAKRGDMGKRKPALTKTPLEACLATCDDSLRGVRDRALLLMAWASGGRRRSELVALQMDNLERVSTDEYLFTLLVSKNNQSGAEHFANVKPIAGPAGTAMTAWLGRSAIQSGPVFRRILRGDKLGGPLSAASVRLIVLERAALAGLEEGFSAHSLRSGFVTEAARQLVPLGDVMALTGHCSVTSVMRYFRGSTSLKSKGANLLVNAAETLSEQSPSNSSVPESAAPNSC